jgi:HEPN domain-containing protein
MSRGHREEAERWLIQAEDELADADDLRKRKRFYLALFHFQQAAEKALKAFLYLHVRSVEVFHTHSIDELLRMAVEIDDDFKQVARAKKLDRYYIPTRYPNSLPGGVPSRHFDDPKEAKEAMTLARRVVELVATKVREG